MTAGSLDPKKVEEFTDRVIGYLSGAGVSALVYLGDRLGLYRALKDSGPSTSADLAAKAGLNERWVREWLHGQASAGLVRYAGDGRFEFTSEQAAVLADEENPAFAGGGFALIMPLLQRWERLFESFRTGRGVPYNDLGADHAVGESRFSSPWMRANLVPVTLPGLDGVVSRLAAGAKVADVGCGSGKALLEIARAYPHSDFHGYDSSELAIRFAEAHLARMGLRNVTFHRSPANTLPRDASFDFILTWDCLHDMTDPAGAMRSIRAAIKPDGTWLIVDINGMPSAEENYAHPFGCSPLFVLRLGLPFVQHLRGRRGRSWNLGAARASRQEDGRRVWVHPFHRSGLWQSVEFVLRGPPVNARPNNRLQRRRASATNS